MHLILAWWAVECRPAAPRGTRDGQHRHRVCGGARAQPLVRTNTQSGGRRWRGRGPASGRPACRWSRAEGGRSSTRWARPTAKP